LYLYPWLQHNFVFHILQVLLLSQNTYLQKKKKKVFNISLVLSHWWSNITKNFIIGGQTLHNNFLIMRWTLSSLDCSNLLALHISEGLIHQFPQNLISSNDLCINPLKGHCHRFRGNFSFFTMYTNLKCISDHKTKCSCHMTS
jgi:hypothetical protein